MQRVSGGYTIIEVLIFLAVSGALLAISMLYLSGRDAETRFSQSMRDVQSKFQDWINDVPSGYPGATSGRTSLSTLNCKITGGDKVQLNKSGGGNNTQCIFLGKAIQVTTAASPPTTGQESKIYAYSVFGRHDLTDPITGEDRLVNNLVEANPMPTVGVPGVSGNADLTEVYQLGGSTKVLSVNSTSVDYTGTVHSGHSRMIGLYLSFSQLSANRNGSQELKTYSYKLDSDVKPGNDSSDHNITDCIRMQTGSCKQNGEPDNSFPDGLKEWDICFGNDNNNDTAKLSVLSSNGLGASTKQEFTPCT
jgi:type II secretory pathway pseudopilin PulG